MTRHPRIPTFLAITISAAAGIALLAATGQFRAPSTANASLEQLEAQLFSRGQEGGTDPALWLTYADKLRQADRFPAAARAYQHALQLQPDNPAARINAGLALAQANDPDTFFAYLNRLTMSYPKLALDLLDRPELRPLHTDPRWLPSLASAQAQAAD
jgi:predicted Zn-dependent protease